MVGEEGNVNAGGVDIDAGIDTGAGVWSWWEWCGMRISIIMGQGKECQYKGKSKWTVDDR